MIAFGGRAVETDGVAPALFDEDEDDDEGKDSESADRLSEECELGLRSK